MTSPGLGYTEEDAAVHLQLLFAQITRQVAQHDDQSRWQVRDGSSLFGDDRKSAPYQVSHEVVGLIGSAIDHLHALQNLVEGANVLHPMATFTLARGAIETASAAAWMLAPAQRLDRVGRRLRFALKDNKDSYQASNGMGLTRPKTQEEVSNRILGIGEAAGIALSELRPTVTSTSMVSAAQNIPGAPRLLLSMWRICSGFAHGRKWATLSVLDREELSSDPDTKVGLYRLSSNTIGLASALHVAVDVTRAATDLYAQRADR
jgi:hypothetical protein